jgi:manganese transport protein
VLDGMHLPSSGNFLSTSELSAALSPLGTRAPVFMGIGFVFAGFLALVVISLGSAWGALEALGKRSRKAFLWVYGLESIPALAVVLLVGNYVQLLLSLMVTYTIIIIPSLYFLGKLVADRRIMNGRHYGRREMAVFWLMSLGIVAGGILGMASLF